MQFYYKCMCQKNLFIVHYKIINGVFIIQALISEWLKYRVTLGTLKPQKGSKGNKIANRIDFSQLLLT